MVAVLVIEKEELLCRLYAVNFGARNHTLYIASDINDAYDYLSCPLDLIILDIPHNNDQEWLLLHYLQTHHNSIPVILTTTLPLPLDSTSAYSNIKKELLKPFSIDQLLSICH